MKKKIAIGAVLVLCLSMLIYSTIAYFNTADTARNVITAGDIKIELQETAIRDGEEILFEQSQERFNVMPGQDVSKIVRVKNTGSNPAYIRVAVSYTHLDVYKRQHNSDRSLPTDWVIGFRWCNYRWPGEALPSKEALDKYFPDRPVIAFNNELHAVWVNSKTMELCGIDKDTPTPQGGIIERDENGEPTGFFLEQPAMEMVTRKALDASPELEEKMIRCV